MKRKPVNKMSLSEMAKALMVDDRVPTIRKRLRELDKIAKLKHPILYK